MNSSYFVNGTINNFIPAVHFYFSLVDIRECAKGKTGNGFANNNIEFYMFIWVQL